MDRQRRSVLAVVGAALATGCTAVDGGATPTGTAEPSPSDGPPECDPADVTRPPVATGENLDGRAYPTKPAELTDQSVLEYLADFETAFAWNRVLETADGTVVSLNIDTLDGFFPDETGDGYLASSGMGVSYTTADETTTQREYVASYFVSPGPVYRTESAGDAADPREQEETTLVQCGADTDGK